MILLNDVTQLSIFSGSIGPFILLFILSTSTCILLPQLWAYLGRRRTAIEVVRVKLNLTSVLSLIVSFGQNVLQPHYFTRNIFFHSSSSFKSAYGCPGSLCPYPPFSLFLSLPLDKVKRNEEKCHFTFWRFFRNLTSVEGRNTTTESKGQVDCGETQAFVWLSYGLLYWGLEPLIAAAFSKGRTAWCLQILQLLSSQLGTGRAGLGVREAEFLVAFQTSGELFFTLGQVGVKDTEWLRVGKDATSHLPPASCPSITFPNQIPALT